jgi:hypothetical protein
MQNGPRRVAAIGPAARRPCRNWQGNDHSFRGRRWNPRINPQEDHKSIRTCQRSIHRRKRAGWRHRCKRLKRPGARPGRVAALKSRNTTYVGRFVALDLSTRSPGCRNAGTPCGWPEQAARKPSRRKDPPPMSRAESTGEWATKNAVHIIGTVGIWISSAHLVPNRGPQLTSRPPQSANSRSTCTCMRGLG